MRAAVAATVIAILRIAFLLRLLAPGMPSWPVDAFEPDSPGESLKLRLWQDFDKRELSLRPRTGLRTHLGANSSPKERTIRLQTDGALSLKGAGGASLALFPALRP